MTMDGTSNRHFCPYCGQPLHWIAHGWAGNGTYECDRCGEFPDVAAQTHGPVPLEPARAADPLAARRGARRPRVLLVDDTPEYRDLYAVMLDETATVITASSGVEALAVAAAERPDVIVLDVMMPGMDGWQTCERLKADPATRAIPVIMLTSLDGLDVPATAARVGAAYVVLKPGPVERLTRAIQEALRPIA